jgi:hypothetical protein
MLKKAPVLLVFLIFAISTAVSLPPGGAQAMYCDWDIGLEQAIYSGDSGTLVLEFNIDRIGQDANLTSLILTGEQKDPVLAKENLVIREDSGEGTLHYEMDLELDRPPERIIVHDRQEICESHGAQTTQIQYQNTDTSQYSYLQDSQSTSSDQSSSNEERQSKLETRLESKNETIEDLRTQLDQANEEPGVNKSKVNDLQSELREKNQKIMDLQEKVMELQNKVSSLQEKISENQESEEVSEEENKETNASEKTTDSEENTSQDNPSQNNQRNTERKPGFVGRLLGSVFG